MYRYTNDHPLCDIDFIVLGTVGVQSAALGEVLAQLPKLRQAMDKW